jgi:futalosine hydrolase
MLSKHEICSMHILLIAATEMEILQRAADNNVDVLITGVGIPSTIYHLQKRLQQMDYDLVIQAGIGGSFGKEPALEETILVEKDTFGDLGTEKEEEYCTLFDAKLADKNEFPFTDGWLINKNEWLNAIPLKKARAVTVNKVSDDKLLKRQIENAFHPHIETMEGAALHYVCLQEKIPFLQIRSISNCVGERNKAKWKLEAAIKNLNNELEKIIAQITLNPKSKTI